MFVSICESSNTKQEAYKRMGMHRNTFEKYYNEFGLTYLDGSVKTVKKYPLEDILNGKYPYYNSSHLNRRLIEEGIKKRVCECCGNSDWMGLPIVLELHHIDGDKTNNRIENLQLLCPNCHSITDNFKSKKVKLRNNSSDNN